MVDFGLIETRLLRNAVLSASARGLSYVRVMLLITENDLTYLIISCDKIGNCMECPSSREFTRADHGFKTQLLLAVLLGCSRLGNFRWSRPVIYCYITFFTPLLVDFIMLSDVETIRRIASLVKSLSNSIRFNKFYVISISK